MVHRRRYAWAVGSVRGADELRAHRPRGRDLPRSCPKRHPFYPTGGEIRLILHGSSEHLLSNCRSSAQEVSDDAIDAAMGYSIGNPQHLLSEFLIDLSSADEPIEQDPSTAIKRVERKVPGHYTHLIQVLSSQLDLSRTAAWMGGHARITAVPQPVDGIRIVVATPSTSNTCPHPKTPPKRRHVDAILTWLHPGPTLVISRVNLGGLQ